MFWTQIVILHWERMPGGRRMSSFSHRRIAVMEIETLLLILVAVLEVVDGQGIALRMLRFLSSLVENGTNGKKTDQIQTKS